MKKLILLSCSLLAMLLVLQVSGQTTPKLVVTPLENPGQIPDIVRSILDGGGFDTIYAINYTGNLKGIGTFIDGDDLGVKSGIILSSGYVKNAEGYNVTGAQYSENDALIDTIHGGGNDEDLAKLLAAISGNSKPVPVADASVLTFYVKPYTNKITITYVFASEEYEFYNSALKPDFKSIDSTLMDMFGIFIWANPADKHLISIVQGGPGDWYPVGIKYVHPPVPSNFGPIYVQNPPDPPLTPPYSTEFDAFTVPMLAMNQDFEVIPCQTYGVKIAVADYYYNGSSAGYPFANFFNTAVFLKEGSLIGGSGLEWDLTFKSDNNEFGPKEMVEGGCSNMIITLKKNKNMADTLWVRFKLVNADASEYTITPTPYQDSLLWIPPHDDSSTFILSAISDGIPEGTDGKEKWWFRYQEDPCDIPMSGWGTQHQGYSGVDSLFVYDYTPFSNGSKTYGPTPNTIYYCGNQITLSISDILQGGIPPYFFSWVHQPTGTVGLAETFPIYISANPDISTCYVRDRCTDFSIYPQGAFDVTVYSELTAQASPDFQLCENLVWPITIEESNVGDDFTVEWYFQGNLVSTDKIYVVDWDDYAAYYQVIEPLVFDYIVSDDCGNEVLGHVDAYWDPIVDISGPAVICLGDPITLSCTPGQSYQWYTNSVAPGNVIPGATNQNYSFTPAAANNYTLCVEIINACDQPAASCFTFEVSELQCQVELDGSTVYTVCPETPFTLQEMNGFAEWHWTWSDDGQNFNATGQTINLSLVTPGNHSITVSAYNEHGCYNEVTITVNVFPYNIVSTSAEFPAVCEGFPLWIRAQSSVQAATYSWSASPFDDDLTGQEGLQQPIVAPEVPTTYTCVINDINGCPGQASIFIDIREPIQGFVSTNPDLICTGEPALIDFTGNTQPGYSSFSWTFEGGDPPTGNLPSQNVVWTTAGTYDISLHIDEPGCEADFVFPVTIEPLPEPMMQASNNKGCQPLTVDFQDQSQNLLAPGYLWDFGDGNTSTLPSPEHTYPNPGTYTVTLTILNSTGCEQTKAFPDAIEVYPLPDAVFDADPPAATLDNPKILFLPGTSGPGNQHTWDFGDGSSFSSEASPIHTYSAVGTYTVIHTIENQYGCLDIDTLEIGISKDLKIFVPNTFTPNGDGLNDCFAVSGTVSDVVDRFTVKIHNKWGQVIYEDRIKSYDCIWDGTGRDGKPLEGGEYVYVISGKDLQGKKHVYQGVLILLK